MALRDGGPTATKRIGKPIRRSSRKITSPNREAISHRVHKRLEISIIEGVDGEWYAEVLAWKMS
jgi:hypothetical protein